MNGAPRSRWRIFFFASVFILSAAVPVSSQVRADQALGPLIREYRKAQNSREKITLLKEICSLYYREKMWDDALVYIKAWKDLDPQGLGALRWAEYQALYGGDRVAAGAVVARLRPQDDWSPRDRDIWLLLGRMTRFTRWDLQPWGLTDTNISAMVQDQDDLWIGTWNGGLVRYSLATREVTTFRTGEYRQVLTTIRCMAVDPWYVYVGGFEGLWRYSKLSQNWSRIIPPQDFPLERIQDMTVAQGKLTVATLGGGVWEWKGGQWKSWESYGWPHVYVNKILPSQSGFYVATMDRGAWFFEPGKGTPRFLGEGYSGSFPSNITFILEDSGDLWFGTYGKGLVRKDGETGRWQTWNQAQGTLQDDYLIAGTSAGGGLLFGTLGKGFAYYSRRKEKLIPWEPGPTGGPADVSALGVLGSKILLGTLGEGLLMAEEAILETELP